MYDNSLEVLYERQRNLTNLIQDSIEWSNVPDLLFGLKRLRKQILSVKAAAQAPLQVQLLKIRNEFAEIEVSTEKREEELKARVLQEHKLCNQRRDSAIQEANDSYSRSDLEGVQQAMLKAAEAELDLPTGISLRQQVRIEIADKSQIPIAYLKTDDAKIRAAKQEIPGVIKRHELVVAVTVDGEEDE